MKDKKVGEISTFIGPGADIVGTVNFQDTIRLDGRVEGKILGVGTLIVGKTARIKADIDVGKVIIRGQIEGNVKAKDSVEIYAPAQVTGNISAAVVSIEKGVRFDGNCDIQNEISQSKSGSQNDEKAVKIAQQN